MPLTKTGQSLGITERLDERSLGSHHGAALVGLTPDRSRIRPKSSKRRCWPTPYMPGLCPVSVKGIQAAPRAARTLP